MLAPIRGDTGVKEGVLLSAKEGVGFLSRRRCAGDMRDNLWPPMTSLFLATHSDHHILEFELGGASLVNLY